MNVSELIKELEKMPGDKRVLMQSSGDEEDINEIRGIRNVFGDIVLEIRK